MNVQGIKIKTKPKVRIKGMEARNACPHCKSKFVFPLKDDLINFCHLERLFGCKDCGKLYSHTYEIKYSHSDLYLEVGNLLTAHKKGK